MDRKGLLILFSLMFWTGISCKTYQPPCISESFSEAQLTTLENSQDFISSIKKFSSAWNLFCFSNEKENYLVVSDSAGIKIFLFDFKSIRKVREVKIKPKQFLFNLKDTFFLFDKDTRHLYKIKNLFSGQAEYDTIRNLEKKPTGLSDHYLIDPSSTRLMNINSTYTFIYNYGLSTKSKTNYVDKTPFFYILGDSIVRIGVNGTDYLSNHLPKRNTLFDIDENNVIYQIGMYSNALYKINSHGEVLANVNTSICNQFGRYKPDRMTNLAYLRKYISENEQNVALGLLNGEYVVVLKKEKQPAVLDPPRFIVIIYTRDLKEKLRFRIEDDIRRKLFIFRNKILFLSYDLNKSYLYEFTD